MISCDRPEPWRALATKSRLSAGANPVGVIQLSPVGIVTRANDVFLGLLGYSRAALPLRLDSVTPVEWQPWDTACLASVMVSGQTCWYHKEFISSRGHVIPVMVVLSSGFDADRDCLATVVDLSTLADDPLCPCANPVLQIALDADGSITSINPAGAGQLGYSVDELVGQSGSLVLDEAEWVEVRDELRLPLRTGATYREGWSTRRRRDGSVLPVCQQLRFSMAPDGRQLAYLVSTATGSPEATARTILECQDRIQLLTTELSEAKANEQERFSIGLHDEVSQPLAAARFKLAILEASLSAHERGSIATIVASLDQAIQATRAMTLQLNAPMLAGPDLIVTLRELGKRLMAAENIAFEFQCEAAPLQPDTDVSLTLFRAVRELLCNVAKHSGASRAKLTIAAENGTVRIGVEDNGQGFRSTDAHPGFGRPGAFGLFSIHEQLRHLGGRLEIFNVSDQGARVVLTLPVLSGTAASV